MSINISKIRNIGISAHIDSGKTTLTERILFYTNKIRDIHDVKGKDGVGAFMDSMELEKERGITIASAATYCRWMDYDINIIDTPGHVDFTIEVERSLRVLDGAILVLCAVGGVQSQSITVTQQMKRYKVPKIAFINKCDRDGADPFSVVKQLKNKLKENAILLQIPIGTGKKHEGVIDLISMKALYFEGQKGDSVKSSSIPKELLKLALSKREELIDLVSIFSDKLTNAILEDKIIEEEILISAIRKGTIDRKLTPVLLGSAYKNKGVQPLLDSINNFLPSPSEVINKGIDIKENKPVVLYPDPLLPTIAIAFKLEDGKYGQLTYIRVYQGIIKKGDFLINIRTNKKVRIGRVVKMHSHQMEEIEKIYAGEIGALFGIDCASGDTIVTPGSFISMNSMFIPKPVISLAIKSQDNKSEINMLKALNRFSKEDPTFKTHINHTTSETIISGMGELHLEVYIERMRREYKVNITVGIPQVTYKETITKFAKFNYTHKKQTGGAGQFAKIAGYIEPSLNKDFIFENKIRGGAIPTQFIPACEKGFKDCLKKGPKMKFPVTGIKIVINDGAFHNVDSSEKAFHAAAKGAFNKVYHKACPVIQEPIMNVSVEIPIEFQGKIVASLNKRRGIVIGANDKGYSCVIEAQVPLVDMFGYTTVLRSLTQGKGQFVMEFLKYKIIPNSIEKELLKKN